MPRITATTLEARSGLVQIGPRCALSDRASADFDRWYVNVLARARRCAGKCVRKQDVDDVVQSAATRLLAACTDFHAPRAFPATEAGFRRLFLTIVRNLASDYRRFGGDAERSTHKFWGEGEPHLPKRHMADRSLAPDTESLWLDDAEADEDEDGPTLRVPRRGVYDAPPDEVKVHYIEFAEFIDRNLNLLTPMQGDMVEYIIFDGCSRTEVARLFKISPKTVDTHLARALERLQSSLLLWLPRDAYDDNPWRDRIQAMWYAMLVRKCARDVESVDLDGAPSPASAGERTPAGTQKRSRIPQRRRRREEDRHAVAA